MEERRIHRGRKREKSRDGDVRERGREIEVERRVVGKRKRGEGTEEERKGERCREE